MSEILFNCIIPGRPRVKKNSKRIFAVSRPGAKTRVRVLSSEQFVTWEQGAMREVRSALNNCASKGLTYPIPYAIEAHYRFYFENKHGEADTSNLIEGPQDVLEKVGVIVNDKLITKLTAEKFFGHEPRVEIILKRIGED